MKTYHYWYSQALNHKAVARIVFAESTTISTSNGSSFGRICRRLILSGFNTLLEQIALLSRFGIVVKSWICVTDTICYGCRRRVPRDSPRPVNFGSQQRTSISVLSIQIP